jgi:hypothetical protein
MANNPTTTFSISIHTLARRVVLVLGVITVLLVVAGTLVVLAHEYLPPVTVHYPLAKLDLNEENNLPTWFSSIGLFLDAAVLAWLAVVRRKADPREARFWPFMAVVFVLLSLDEMASFHELTVHLIREYFHLTGYLFYAWVIPGALFVLAVFSWSLRALAILPPDTRWAMILAGAVYCAGALVMEMIGGKLLTAWPQATLAYGAETVVEETLEMVGSLMFLRALLTHLDRHVGSVTVHLVAADQ